MHHNKLKPTPFPERALTLADESEGFFLQIQECTVNSFGHHTALLMIRTFCVVGVPDSPGYCVLSVVLWIYLRS